MNYVLSESQLKGILAKLDPKVYPEACDYLSNLIDSGNCDGSNPYEIACELILADKPERYPQFMIDFITELFMKSINEGNAAAMNDLGAVYYDGDRGFEQSFEKSVYYYKLAAEQGERQAQENLGYCYYYGRNMPVDYEKAFHYFALGAFDGHLISLYKIGDMYLNGYYVKKNEAEAFHIYSRCLETMTEEAAPDVAGPVFLRLGKMYLNGLGTEKDAKAALNCYQRAELYLYDMVKGGNVMYKKSLHGAIDGQQAARNELSKALPGGQWRFD